MERIELIAFKELFLRRLFSSFARGWPGVGLLLMRIVAAITVGDQAVVAVRAAGLNGSSAPAVLGAGAGSLLLAGLWTPAVGTILAVIELWNVVLQPGDPWIYILLCTISAALAMLGPGAYSADARIFGWKRIEIGDR